MVVPLGANSTGLALAKPEPSHHCPVETRRSEMRTFARPLVASPAVPQVSSAVLVAQPAV